MTETEADSAADPAPALPDLALTPLGVAALPPAVAKLLSGASPAKLMAVKGIAALRPAELLIAIYQMSFDADPAVKAAAESAPGALPDRVLLASLPEALPATVLHFFALNLAPNRSDALEKVLLNRATADETFVALAARLAERELEIIFQNDARLLRCPAILRGLYFNAQARMSSVSRAIELCARNGVRVEGIPAYDEIVRSISEDPAGSTATVADDMVAAVLEDQPAAEPPEPVAAPAPVPVSAVAAPARPAPAKVPPARKSIVIDFSRLKLFEKIRLATLGNEYCRQNLVRDPNRIVAMAAIRSPKITEGEIVKIAANKGVCEEVIRYIANQRDLVKMYAVRFSLVQNPKCPLTFAMRFLNQLQADDLKNVSRSKNVPAALSGAAKRLIQKRAASG